MNMEQFEALLELILDVAADAAAEDSSHSKGYKSSLEKAYKAFDIEPPPHLGFVKTKPGTTPS